MESEQWKEKLKDIHFELVSLGIAHRINVFDNRRIGSLEYVFSPLGPDVSLPAATAAIEDYAKQMKYE